MRSASMSELLRDAEN